ncbi:MAG: RNA polymerase sigma factor RpoD/SigA [Bacteroidota bacterium]
MRALVITNSITRRDERSIEKYLNEIAKYEVLSPEEELRLFQRIREGDDVALQKIINHNLRFVVSVAKQYQHVGLKLGDLINEGNIGLIKAAKRFDETKGFKFISYAVWWIRQSILQSISERSREIRIPQNQQAQVSKLLQKRTELIQKLEREPSMAELANATELTESFIRQHLLNADVTTSLDARIDSEGDTTLSQLMEDSQIKKPDYNLMVTESQRLQVEQLLHTLPTRTSTIIKLYFGIDRGQSMTLKDISELLGLSRERVRQIMERGLRKLRMRTQAGVGA